jgi:hypothetical protein
MVVLQVLKKFIPLYLQMIQTVRLGILLLLVVIMALLLVPGMESNEVTL